MKKSYLQLISFISVLSLFLFFGCKNNAGPNFDEGRIKIITLTEGDNTEGYMLQFNENKQQEIAANDTLIFDNQEYGTYELTLNDLPEDCSVSGENPVIVQVENQDEITVTFEVICSETPIPNPDTGTLEIIARTSLINSGQMYTLIINGTEQHEISANDTLSINLEAGNYTLELDGVTSPCRIDNGPSNEIIIEVNETFQDDFYVFCQTVFDYRILYESNFPDGNLLFVIQPDGTVESLVNDFDYYGLPVLSPDNTEIAFTAYTLNIDREYELYLVNTDGTNLRKLTDFDTDLRSIGSISWSPDGSKIAFSKAEEYNTDDIYIVNQNGSGLMQLTDNSDIADRYPKWSPDGSLIAFQRKEKDSYDIYLMNSDGSNITNLTNTPSRDEESLSWSPDGSKLRYSASENGNRNIYINDVDSGDLVNITQSQDYRGEYEAWSPDGSKIAYVQYNSDRSESNIYVMNADGSSPTKLTTSVYQQGNTDPVWSPDGEKIVFTRNVFLYENYFSEKFYHVFVMNVDGSEINDLTIRGPEGFNPTWLPLD